MVAFALGSALLTLSPPEPLPPVDARALADTLADSGNKMDEATLERVLQAIDVIDFEAGLSAILTGLLSNAPAPMGSQRDE
ncbi:hypothetical protein GCM10009807_11950 [Microbacterium lacus]|uniref:Uncharacterized protein n=1 Tax=Microbacterium lacus TaxID=415217 RepID=A0ABN2GDC8_9MICO